MVGVTRPMLRGVRRGDELHENGRALHGIRASQVGRGWRTSRCAAGSAGSWESSWTASITIRGASPLREELVRPQRTTKEKGKEVTHSLPLSTYSAPGALRQDPGRAAESPAEARTCGNQGFAKYACPCRRIGLAGPGLRGATGRNATLLYGGIHDRCDRCRRRTDRLDAGQ